MKKILFVFTGGTIGSSVKGEYISTDSQKPYLLIEGYKKRFEDMGEYATLVPYTLLSENLSGEHLFSLISAVKNNIDNYEGIVVTHGTDTLSYSASALGYALGNCSIPVCVVSANRPLEDESSNGYWNLHGALQFIEKVGKGGVWVPYKNDDDYVKIHRGCRLYPQVCFSHNVNSVKDMFYGYFDGDFNFVENPDFYEKEDEITPIFPSLEKQCKGIMKIDSYPSMVYPEISKDVKYIIMGSYHSGTIDTMSDSSKTFFRNALNSNVRVYLTGVESGIQYESTNAYSSLGIIPLPCISPTSAFIKLWFLTSSEEREVDSEMFLSLGGDVL